MTQKKKVVRQYKLPQALKSVLQKEEYSLYEEYFNTEASQKLREKLIELLLKDIELNYATHDKETKYETPAWSEYQADAIGYRRSCRKLINILQ